MPTPITYRHSVFRLLYLLALSATLQTCAALPDVRYLRPAEISATPTVAGAKGPLSERKAESLIARRLRGKADLRELAVLEEAATGRPLIAGNKVALLYDGPQTMSAMMAAIAAARDHINLETYIFDQDELGFKFADMLIAKQREGVQVKIIYDSVGTLGTPPEFFDRMRAAGIDLLEFNPVNPLKRFGSWQVNNRDHRKILIVDGTVGFTGGVNISKTYSKSSLFRSKGSGTGWRDTHLKIEGPAVAALQWLFLDTWVKQRAEDLPERQYFPRLAKAGDKLVRIVASEPGSDFEIYRAYILAIQQAKTSIHLTSAYFVPDVQLVEALKQAAGRGVDVRIVLPGISDIGMVLHASRSYYDELLAAGIKIYQMQVSVLHAKTAVIDGAWSTVGSTNIDMRSFMHNNEISVIVLGEGFGRDMEVAFNEDLKNSRLVTREEWNKRPWGDRVKEWAARAFEYWL